MFYAGIDVAMDKHDCVILDANGKCFIEVFTFKNSRDGFEQLMSELQSLTRYRAPLLPITLVSALKLFCCQETHSRSLSFGESKRCLYSSGLNRYLYTTYLPSTSWYLFRYAIIKVLFIRFAFLHFHAFSS